LVAIFVMIRATTEEEGFLTKLTNGTGTVFSDVPVDQGGTGTGFRPHQLLEASVAASAAISVRLYAKSHGLPLDDITIEVRIDCDSAQETVVRCEIEIHGGQLTNEQRTDLLAVAHDCPVRRTLSRPIRFEAAPAIAVTAGSAS
jgi:putative redox protein